jgi:hypothetical protein
VKEELVEEIRFNPSYFNNGMPVTNPIDHMPCLLKRTTTYNRYQTIPTGSGVVDFSALGTYHYTKLGELILQLR